MNENGIIKHIYVYPDISVEHGTSTLDILSYKGTVLFKLYDTKLHESYMNER